MWMCRYLPVEKRPDVAAVLKWLVLFRGWLRVSGVTASKIKHSFGERAAVRCFPLDWPRCRGQKRRRYCELPAQFNPSVAGLRRGPAPGSQAIGCWRKTLFRWLMTELLCIEVSVTNTTGYIMSKWRDLHHRTELPYPCSIHSNILSHLSFFSSVFIS